MRHLVSRADLARAWLAGGRPAARALASLAGAVEVLEDPGTATEERLPAVGPDPGGAAQASLSPGPFPAQTGPDWAPIPLWRILSRVLTEDADAASIEGALPLRVADLGPPGVDLDPPPLVAWSDVERRLASLLTVQDHGVPFDLGEAVSGLARQERPLLWHRRAVRRMPRQLHVIADRDATVTPIWRDRQLIKWRLRRLLGRSGVRVAVLRGVDGAMIPSPRSPALAHGAPRLLLTGGVSAGEVRARVMAMARRTAMLGGRAVALVAGPLGDGPAVSAEREVDAHPVEPVPMAPWGPEAGQGRELRRALSRWVLARVLAVPRYFEPGLLRTIRTDLGVPEADVGVELAVWRMAAQQHTCGATLDPADRRRLQGELQAALGESPSELRARLARALRASSGWNDSGGSSSSRADSITESDAIWTADLLRRACRSLVRHLAAWREGACPAFLYEELITADALAVGDPSFDPLDERQRAEVAVFLGRVAESVDAAGADDGAGDALARWLRQSFEEAPDPLRRGDVHPEYLEAWRRAEARDPGRPRAWTVVAVGEGVGVRSGEAGEESPSGSPEGHHRTRPLALGNLRARRPVVSITGDPSQGRLALGSNATFTPRDRTVWTSDLERLVLERFEPESWMSAWGFGSDGLWVEVGERYERVRFFWRPPEEPEASADADADAATTTGSFELDRATSPSWIDEAGIDAYGAHASFRVGDVTHRMRWVPPGTFRMGSPESEVGRYEDEVPHQVILTAGFWLGEVPCTQALYGAVTRMNPSHFEGADHPVEQVSWDDAQAMLRALGKRIPGLAPRLPTEAEWEYACRAGTMAATYAGDLTDPDREPILDRIAWHGGNSESRTHRVGTKERNPWGFADMLGNVWEWCADSYGSYSRETVEDPRGPGGGASRVRRGGAWYYAARFCRAASRFGSDPALRRDSLGFRLSRGQGFVSSGAGGQDTGEASPERGRDAPRRRPRWWPWGKGGGS